MAELWLLAVGFGLLPMTALLLHRFPSVAREYASVAWGVLAGIVAFLGLGHAMAAVLVGNSYLRYLAHPALAAGLALAGAASGMGLAFLVLDRPVLLRRGGVLLWGGALFLLIHSFGDGLVLGEAYAGSAPSGWPLGALPVAATVVHRFAEGALVVVPALAATLRPSRSAPWLLAGLATIPAAAIPVALFAGPGSVAIAAALDQGVGVFVAAFEAGFAFLLLPMGYLPRALNGRDMKWALGSGAAFLGMLFVHFLVE